MNTKERLWQAYLDGELSASEATEFESSLSESERKALAADMRFEHGLHELLSEGACPDPVWERTQALIRRTAPPRQSGSRRYWVAASLAAACLAFVLLVVSGELRSRSNTNVIHAASSVNALASTSDVAPGHDNAVHYLKQHGIHLGIHNEPELEAMYLPHRPIKVVGARQDTFAGDRVTEVLFSCCGYPVKVLVARQDSPAAKAIGRATGQKNSDVQATKIVDGYLAAVVSRHPAHGLVNALEAGD